MNNELRKAGEEIAELVRTHVEANPGLPTPWVARLILAEMPGAGDGLGAAGGATLLAPTWIPGMHTVALMADPHGNTVGLIISGTHA